MVTYLGMAAPAWPQIETDRDPADVARADEYLDRIGALSKEYGFRLAAHDDLEVVRGDEAYFTDVQISEDGTVARTLTKQSVPMPKADGLPIYEAGMRRWKAFLAQEAEDFGVRR